MNFGSHRLREIRRQNGISQVDLAAKYEEITGEDMKQATLSRIERGEMIFTWKHAVGFISALKELGVHNADGGELSLDDLLEAWAAPVGA